MGGTSQWVAFLISSSMSLFSGERHDDTSLGMMMDSGFNQFGCKTGKAIEYKVGLDFQGDLRREFIYDLLVSDFTVCVGTRLCKNYIKILIVLRVIRGKYQGGSRWRPVEFC